MHFSAEVIFEKRLSPREGKNAIESRVFEKIVGPPEIGGPPFGTKDGSITKSPNFPLFCTFSKKATFHRTHEYS